MPCPCTVVIKAQLESLAVAQSVPLQTEEEPRVLRKVVVLHTLDLEPAIRLHLLVLYLNSKREVVL